MTDKSNNPRRPSTDRERAAKMRSAYTNPYKTVSAARRRIQSEVQEERDSGRSNRRDRRDSDRRSNNPDEFPQSMIEEALRNPTKTVTEAELREQYHHVITDVRSMAVLAAGLVVVLVALAFILPR